MTRAEWFAFAAALSLCVIAGAACYGAARIDDGAATRNELAVLRETVVRLEMEVETLRSVEVDIKLTVVDKSTPVQIVEVER